MLCVVYRAGADAHGEVLRGVMGVVGVRGVRGLVSAGLLGAGV